MGKAIILPASHIGGRRYMIQNYHNSIAMCRVFGPPDFFTFTYNPKWPEIVNSFYDPKLNPSDKSDVIVRVYHMKLEELISDIKSGMMFGPCNASNRFLSVSKIRFYICTLYRTSCIENLENVTFFLFPVCSFIYC
jgi:hypothetical protein